MRSWNFCQFFSPKKIFFTHIYTRKKFQKIPNFLVEEMSKICPKKGKAHSRALNPNFEAYALGLPPSRLPPSNEGRSSRASPLLKQYYTNYSHTVVSCQVSTIHFLVEWLFYFEKNYMLKNKYSKIFSIFLQNIEFFRIFFEGK